VLFVAHVFHDFLHDLVLQKRLSIHVQNPWLDKIISGEKTIEGRKGDVNKFYGMIGKKILLYNDIIRITMTLVAVRHYDTLLNYLRGETLKVLPGVQTIEEAVDVYHKFYSDHEIELAGGMCALELSKN
jgi:ASC-1-like (ASCH) protein